MIKKYVNNINIIKGIKLEEDNISEVIDFICNDKSVEEVFQASLDTILYWTRKQKKLYFNNYNTKQIAYFGDYIINTGERIYPIKDYELEKHFSEVLSNEPQNS